MRPPWSSLIAISACLLPATLCKADSGDPPQIGARAADLEFKDIRFLRRTLRDLGDRKAYVIVATRPKCPIARRYLPVLAEMEKPYRDRSVQFLALVVDDSPIAEMAADAVEAGAEFPFVQDIDGRCMSALGLRRTPEVVVLDVGRGKEQTGDEADRRAGDRETERIPLGRPRE